MAGIVIDVNPKANDDVFELIEDDGFLLGNVLGNDIGANLSVKPYHYYGKHGVLSFEPNGDFRYELRQRTLKDGEFGQDKFTYHLAGNSGLENTATITINVIGSTSLTPVEDNYTILESQGEISGNVLDNDTKSSNLEIIQGDSIYGKRYGELYIDGDGNFKYILKDIDFSPNAVYQESFLYTLHSDEGEHQVYFNIKIIGEEDRPIIKDVIEVDFGGVVSGALPIVDKDSTQWSVRVVNGDVPKGLALNPDGSYQFDLTDLDMRGKLDVNLPFTEAVLVIDVADESGVYTKSDVVFRVRNILRDGVFVFDGSESTDKNDIFLGNSGNNTAHTGQGHDDIYGGSDSDTLNAGAGIDLAYGGSGDDHIYGELDADLLYGDSGEDRLYGGEGNDKIVAGSGNDLLHGESGSDILYGDNGKDIIYGGDDHDVIYTGSKVDQAFGGLGNDEIHGASGDDQLDGADGVDLIRGGSDQDHIYGGAGTDQLYGDSGNDVINAGNDSDLLEGGSGVDQLYGNNGSDRLFGQSGDDVLYGGSESDILDGGTGFDVLVGGVGADNYLFSRGSRTDVVREEGQDIDRITFAQDIYADQLWFSRQGKHLAIQVIGSTDDIVMVRNWYEGASNQVEQIKSGDGLKISHSQVQVLVDAMASLSPPAVGQTTLDAATQQQLAVALEVWI